MNNQLRSLEKGFTIWLTGLPCAGKTTIANSLKSTLNELGLRVEVLDGDTVRKGLSPNLGFSKEDRDSHNKRVIFMSKILSRNGIIAVVSLISPYRETRAFAKSEISDLVEVYVNCDIDTCIERDVKGLYALALKGEITNMTGIQDPYEPPLTPNIMVNTKEETVQESTSKIMEILETLDLIPHRNKVSLEGGF